MVSDKEVLQTKGQKMMLHGKLALLYHLLRKAALEKLANPK